MPEASASLFILSVLITPLFSSAALAQAQVAPSHHIPRNFNPLDVDTPSPEDGPPASANALRDPAYLPAQIGGIVGAYALSLVLVAITLLSLAKKRRAHLNAGHDEIDFEDHQVFVQLERLAPPRLDTEFAVKSQNRAPNFSYPSPARAAFDDFELSASAYYPSPVSSTVAQPGLDPFVDQRVVAQDKMMAQNQLEEMYKHVMEHEAAKQRGEVLEQPVYPNSIASRHTSMDKPPSTISKKARSKPASLNLAGAKEEKSSGSRTASFLSALKSPRKKPKGVSISSPIMTPQSATFPRAQDTSSMSSIAPRHYAPPPPPPIPNDQVSIGVARTRGNNVPSAQDYSPESVQSIDERIGSQLDMRTVNNHQRDVSEAPTEHDPESAVSEHSMAPLVGLPLSPKPGATFPTLPASPKPGATFSRPNAPSAVRTGGSLPLRAYEPAMTSPSVMTHTTKQTVFERKGPLSPMSARTPGTGVPYTPYQPFTPCIPVTPSLVTKEDRKRMRKMVPKTPTLEMVQSSDDMW